MRFHKTRSLLGRVEAGEDRAVEEEEGAMEVGEGSGGLEGGMERQRERGRHMSVASTMSTRSRGDVREEEEAENCLWR